MTNRKTSERLKDMAWLLNDMIGDLKTPVDLLHIHRSELNDQNFMSLARLLASVSVINLCKFEEITKHYGKEIRHFPAELLEVVRSIKRVIETRNMYRYRSQYIAHAFVEEKGSPKKPLSFAQSIDAMKGVLGYEGGDVHECIFSFCSWIYDVDDDKSVVNVIYRLIKHIDNEVGGLGSRYDHAL